MNRIPGMNTAYLLFLLAGWVTLVAGNLFMPGVALTDWVGDASAPADSVVAQGLFAQAEAAMTEPSAADLSAVKPRCEECGVIDSNRRIEATDGSPASYEIILRMSDGSLRVLKDARPASLERGERITLIAGSGPSNR